MLEIKGLGVQTYISYVKDVFGQEGYEKWLAALSDDARELVQDTILTSSWYDARIGAFELREKICDVFFDGDPASARDFGKYSANHSLRGIYKVFVKVGSPGWLIDRVGKVFTKFFRPGMMYAVEKSSNHAVIRLVDFPEHSRYIEESLCGYMEQGLIICGVKDPKVVMKSSVLAGDHQDEFEASWS